MSRGGLGISHLFFVDDILLYKKAKSSHMRLVDNVLSDFYDAYGLKVNIEKSRFMISKMVSRMKRVKFAYLSSLKVVNDLGKYLWFPLFRVE